LSTNDSLPTLPRTARPALPAVPPHRTRSPVLRPARARRHSGPGPRGPPIHRTAPAALEQPGSLCRTLRRPTRVRHFRLDPQHTRGAGHTPLPGVHPRVSPVPRLPRPAAPAPEFTAADRATVPRPRSTAPGWFLPRYSGTG